MRRRKENETEGIGELGETNLVVQVKNGVSETYPRRDMDLEEESMYLPNKEVQ